jgi:primosomal protein N' (replication factor Y)
MIQDGDLAGSVPAILVAVDAPLPTPLSYLLNQEYGHVERGQSVHVPLGKRHAHGVVLGPTNKSATESEFKLRPIGELNLDRPCLPEPYMRWLEWMANYYLHPIGLVMETVFPPLTKKSKRVNKKKSVKKPVVPTVSEQSAPPDLTPEQTQALKDIQSLPGFQVHLLHGVTGSGKTEVYLNLLKEVVAQGKQGLVLVPEIALTPQLIDRFSKRFPDQIAVLHSHLTEREKTNQWWSMVSGEKKILIGARSALFCPLPELGLIVLDEEHEPSYKQDEKLKYHARDSAIVLANKLNIPIVLGSATPSLESWNNALSGKYRLHRMAERVNSRPMPSIEVIDLRQENQRRKETPSELPFWLSTSLHEELKRIFAYDEQAALFLNRRGIAQSAQCRACGIASECPNCSVSLTLHGNSHLVCHYCDYSERLNINCPNCGEEEMLPLGLGTEKIEADMLALFPNLRIARADRDEIQSREHLESMIQAVEKHEVDLLIGTQMIAKGLDFPKLNLVGLVLADVGFHWPDFRASERSFQLLTQVSGRSGRQTAGRVVIQTYNPDHPSVRFTVAGDFRGFAQAELVERADLCYPPAWRMAMFRIHGSDPQQTKLCAARLVERAQALRTQIPSYQNDLHVLGPAQAPLFKLRGRFRFQVMVKCDSAQKLNAFCRQILSNESWLPTGTKVQIDIDPFQML